MKIKLNMSSGPARKLVAHSDYAVASGTCPHCGIEPFKLQGNGMRPSIDDRAYEADGYCVACHKRVGTIRAEPNTLFGVREDTAVLVHGRCRVY